MEFQSREGSRVSLSLLPARRVIPLLVGITFTLTPPLAKCCLHLCFPHCPEKGRVFFFLWFSSKDKGKSLFQKVLHISSHALLTQTCFYVAPEPVPVARGMPWADQLRVPEPVTVAREMALPQFRSFLWSWEWRFPVIYTRVILVPESGHVRKGREGNGTGALEAANGDHHARPNLPQR